MTNSVIQQLRKAKLTGRGGACFPAADKWLMVRKAPLRKGFAGQARGRYGKYVVCNASEGEPQVEKDFFILKNYPETVIDGMMLAINYLKAKKGILYLNPDYYKKLSKKLIAIIGKRNIELFKKSHTAGYIGGEESSALNAIEKKKVEPRLRPPYPAVSGLYGCPTLVNNVETFFVAQKIVSGKFKDTRFFTVNGDCVNHGVFELPAEKTIAQVLKRTENYPDYDFFVQVGGGACGEVLNSDQLDRSVGGSGSITIHSLLKHRPLEQLKVWLKFYKQESCGKCTPCREGTYRLFEIINKEDINWQMIFDLLESLSLTSFCGLGFSVSTPIITYVQNVLSYEQYKEINIKPDLRIKICNCLS